MSLLASCLLSRERIAAKAVVRVFGLRGMPGCSDAGLILKPKLERCLFQISELGQRLFPDTKYDFNANELLPPSGFTLRTFATTDRVSPGRILDFNGQGWRMATTQKVVKEGEELHSHKAYIMRRGCKRGLRRSRIAQLLTLQCGRLFVLGNTCNQTTLACKGYERGA